MKKHIYKNTFFILSLGCFLHTYLMEEEHTTKRLRIESPINQSTEKLFSLKQLSAEKVADTIKSWDIDSIKNLLAQTPTEVKEEVIHILCNHIPFQVVFEWFTEEFNVTDVAFSPDGTLFAYSQLNDFHLNQNEIKENAVVLIDLEKGQKIAIIYPYPSPEEGIMTMRLNFSEDGHFISLNDPIDDSIHVYSVPYILANRHLPSQLPLFRTPMQGIFSKTFKTTNNTNVIAELTDSSIITIYLIDHQSNTSREIGAITLEQPIEFFLLCPDGTLLTLEANQEDKMQIKRWDLNLCLSLYQLISQ